MSQVINKESLPVEQTNDLTRSSGRLGEYIVTTARGAREIEEMRDAWEDMQSHPAADIDYFLTTVDARQTIIRPHVILLSRDGHPETILVGRIEDVQFEFKFGHKTAFKPEVRSLTIVEGGILGNTSYDNCVALISELTEALRQGEADIAYFQEIPLNSLIGQVAKTVPGFLSRDYLPNVDFHHKLTLPDSIDDFLAERKKGRRLANLWKRLQKKYDGNVVLERFTDVVQLDRFCQDMEEISRKTFLHALGKGFIYDTETQELLGLLVERGWFRAYMLYIEGKPCAYWSGVVYKGTLHGVRPCNTGYDPKYAKYELGTIVLLKMIEDLCNTGVQYMDFGPGDSLYKRRFCDLNWQEKSFYIFQPSFKGIKLNAMKTLTSISHQLGNAFLSRLDLKQKWERFKRNQFSTL